MRTTAYISLLAAGLLGASPALANVGATSPPADGSPSVRLARDVVRAVVSRPRPDDGGIWVFGGGALGAAPQLGMNGGGLPQVGVSWRALSWLAPHVSFGYGAFGGQRALDAANLSGHSTLRLSVGSRFVLPVDRVRPYVFGGYSHIHETTFENSLKDPLGTTLALTSSGVEHRSGAEFGLGVLMPVSVAAPWGQTRLDLGLQATVMVLPQFDRWFGLGRPLSVPHDGYALVELSVGIPVWAG